MRIDGRLAKMVIKPRPRVSHKGSFGKVLLIGGSYPYNGAIILSALASVHAGAGLVTVATEKDNISALHSQLPEAMAFDVYDFSLLKQQIELADVLLIGPGLGESVLAGKILDLVLTGVQSHQSLVIDGSALNLLAQENSVHWQTQRLILTPHQKEWERLSGLPISEQNEDNTQEALRFFPDQTVLVAKSHASKIYQGHQIGYLDVGGPYQATGGMGDTLAGMIAAFVAQFPTDLFASVAAATYLHSAIADELAQEAYVVLPSAISKAIPKWMKKLSEAPEMDEVFL